MSAPEQAEDLIWSEIPGLYRDKVGKLTSAFEDEGIQSRASDCIRALTESVVLTLENDALNRPGFVGGRNS